MTAYFFSGLRQLFPPHEAPLSDSVRRIVDDFAGADSLGFTRARRAKPTAKQVKEAHPELSLDEASAAARSIENAERLRDARRRFWVQLLVSLVVLVGAGYMLALGHVAADVQKALFGLIGTVVGYWLR